MAQVLEGWYPSAEEGDKRGVVLVVTAAKEGAVTGGKSFLDVGDQMGSRGGHSRL